LRNRLSRNKDGVEMEPVGGMKEAVGIIAFALTATRIGVQKSDGTQLNGIGGVGHGSGCWGTMSKMWGR